MPIDPSIPLGVRPVPFNNPFEALAQMRDQQQRRQLIDQQIKSGQALEQERLAKVSAEQKAAAEEDEFKRIVSQSLPRDKFIAEVQAKAPGQLDAVMKRIGEHDEAAMRMEKLTFETDKARKEWIGGMLDDVAKEMNPLVAASVLTEIETKAPVYAPQIADMRKTLSEGGPTALKALVEQYRPKKDGKTREIKTRNPDGSEAIQIVEDKPGQTFQSAAAMPKPEPTPDTIDKAIYSARGDGAEMNRLLGIKARMAAAGRDPQAKADNEPLVAIMGPDGKPVLVKRSGAEGKTPATTREQGRQVTSGDAGRLAEIDTSLDNLDTLAKDVDKTGAGSYVGAKWVPNVVTEYTGLGADSKARQGVIDRVKQMIGKALEGGVLRKEDETKYERILPTIGDPPEVAKAKLDGLRELLTQKKQNTIDALKDANYDVTQFEKRVRRQSGTIRARDPQGKLHEAPAGTALPAGWKLEP